MATKGWVFVLFAIIAAEATNTSAPGSIVEHVRTEGLRNSGDNGHTTFNDYLPGFAGRYRNLRSRRSMERLRRSVDLPGKLTPKDCGEIYRSSKGVMDSGIYTIYPRQAGGESNYNARFPVFCRVEDDRAWTVIQRRQDGSVDFYNRTWEDYSRGFGNLWREFWLGNDKIHLLTNQGGYILNVKLEVFKNCASCPFKKPPVSYMQYDSFSVENAQALYKLHLGSYTGTRRRDFLQFHNGWKFVLKPSNTINPHSSCFMHNMGGFWVRRPDTLNPNGFYYNSDGSDCPKLSRSKWPGILGFGFVEMRITKSSDSI
ncbi:PREDICTED: fibrinogen-like protein 1 [Branchiostoma belcheri]|uniref:Fibrinogen-like protein 1 n=1 Tax=Branchiostoma belcheri TaxID=7741 RepID=A0A6P5AAT6_BRABE|nr:PREDICTED: fibrinogen-like protein 1 [Branchiostoma belcheri]